MDNEILQNIWQNLTENNLTDSEFESWSETFFNDTEVQENVHNYLFANQLTDSNFNDWSNNIGLKKKDVLDSASQLEDGGLASNDKGIDTLTPSPQPFLRNRDPGYYPEGEKDTAIERMFGKNEVTDFFGDLYRSGVQGQAQGATVDDALNLFAKGQDVSDEDLAEYIQAYQGMQSVAPSEEMQDFSRIYEDEGKGVYGFLKGVFKNPTVIPQLFTSSVSAMVNKGSLAGGLAGAGAGAAVGALPGALIGGIAGVSGALETGLAYSEFLEEELNKKGLAFDEKGIREVLSDEEAMISIQNRALGRGISIAAIDAMSGGLAAGVTRRAALTTSKGLAAAAGLGIEGAGGAIGEAVARGVAGQEMDVAEIGFEGITGTATAPLTVGAGLLKPASYQLNGGKATRKQVQDLVNKGTPDEIAGAQITIKNDPELFKAAETKKSDAILIAKIKEANPGINEEDEAALLGLEKKRQTLENSTLKSAKNNLSVVDEQIDEISRKYDGTEETIVTTEKQVRESLAAKGIENPTQKQLIEESDLLTNKKIKDADTIESPAEVLDEEQSEVSETVVEGDNQPTELAGETTQAQDETTVEPTQENTIETEVSESETVDETIPRDYNSERFNLLSEEDKVLANKIEDETKRNKFVNNKTIKTNEGIRINETEAAEKALADPNSDEATLIAATRKMEEPTAPFNAAAIVDVQRDLNAIEENNIKGLGVSASAQVTLKYKNQVNDASSSVQETTADAKPSIKEVKQPTVPQQKKKARRARKNIKAGKMGPQPSTTLLTQLFTLDPSIIPNEQKQAYTELLNEVGERAAVLTLSEEQVIAPKAQQILNAVEEQVDTDDGAIAAKTDVDFDVPSESKRIADIKITVDPALDQDSKDLAKEINELTSEDIEGLVKIKRDGTTDVSQIKQLEKVKDNITKGYVPKKASELMIQVRSNKNADALIKPFTSLKRTKILENFRKAMFEIEKAISRPFGGIIAKNYISNRIRNNPKFQIDDILGNFNSKTIYNNTFRKLAEAFSSNETETKKLQAKIDAAYELIAKDKSPIERPHNDIVKDQYKLRLYQLQREHLSNPGNKKTPSAMDFLNITIDAALEGDVLSANDLKILQDLKKEFEVDGEIDNIKIEKSFTKNQKEALKLLDEVNNSLAPKALFTSATIRGNKIDLLNDYSHHVILRDYNPSKEYFQQQQDRFVNPSTKAGTLLERTAGAKPISFDPFLSATRGVQETLLDYHMTVPIKELQQTLNKLETKIKENPNSSNEDIMALKALRASVNESLETVFQSTFTDYSSTLFNKIRTLGYQAALASAPRAVAEFTSNLSFALASNPEGFMNGVSKYMPIIENHELGINFMNNVGSTETNKLYNADELTGKYADLGLFKQVSSKKGQAKSQVNNIANYIAGFGGKQLSYYVNKIANNVLSAPDQWISRPLFMGEFAKTFKAETGITLTSDDMKAIAEGDSKYLGDEYKDAVEKSVISADKQSIQMATSKNPFNAIDKLQQKPGETTKNVWRIANGYMANFSLFEFTTARAAINALFNAGEISSTEAMGLLTGVTMRMTLYMVIYEAIIGQMDEAFGAPEDEDADEADELAYLTGRQLTGALTSLLTRGTLGNIPNIPITMGIEAFNEKYLQSLREDEEYDPFKHAIVFSAIGKEDVINKDLTSLAIKSFAGPYGPLLKTADRTKKVATRALYNKTEKGRQDAKDELTDRLSIEALGNIGLIPFYRDVRRIANKKFFDDKRTKNKSGFYNETELRKVNPKLYKKLYGPNSPKGRLKKKEAEIRKKRKLKK